MSTNAKKAHMHEHQYTKGNGADARVGSLDLDR